MNDLIEQASLLMTAEAMWATDRPDMIEWTGSALDLSATTLEDDTPLFI